MTQISFMETSQLKKHYRRPNERPFLAKEKDHTTILFSGLPLNYEHLLKGAFEGLGYKMEYMEAPDNEAMAMGKEFGNRGQCNPTYFTVGNLLKYLKNLKDKGEEDIENRYAYITVGNCGNCRFGMYEAEYRKTLLEAGFPDFRVMTFEQSTNFSQTGEEAGMQMDATFYIQLLKALMVGDFIHELSHKIRPYEVNPGETDRVTAQVRELLFETFREKKSVSRALKQVKKLYDAIPVDYTRIKPKVKIVGEFYAQTAEGAANYRLFRWLEQEGAEVMVEPVANWVEYVLWNIERKQMERMGLKKAGKGALKTILVVGLVKQFFRLFHWRYRKALGFRVAPLSSMKKLARYAAPYFNPKLEGGEGHLEIGKHVLAVKEKKAHMVISVKPFGCMPSTQSDGSQAKVVTDFPDSVFVAVETSGDSEIHFKSRVQMKLFEAREKAKEEFEKVLAKSGLTRAEFIERARNHSTLFSEALKHERVGTAANFLLGLKDRGLSENRVQAYKVSAE